MKKQIIIIFISFYSFYTFTNTKNVFGQYYSNYETKNILHNISFNLNGGIALPFTDIGSNLTPYKKDWQIAYGGITRKQISPVFGIGGQLLMGKLRGTNLNSDLYFKSKFTELNLHAILNLSNIFVKYKENRSLNIYSTLGIGIINWSSVLYDLNTNIPLFSYSNVTQWKPKLCIPVGLGLQFALNENLGINLEGSVNWINSDNLDVYPSGSSKYDYFAYSSLGFTYKITTNKRSAKKTENIETIESFKEEEPIVKETDYPKIVKQDTTSIAEVKQKESQQITEKINQKEKQISITPEIIIQEDQTKFTSDLINKNIQNLPKTGKIYTVQILATLEPSKDLNTYLNNFAIQQTIYYIYDSGFYKYSSGIFSSFYEAQKYANTLIRNGLSDAFVAIYNNGVRIEN